MTPMLLDEPFLPDIAKTLRSLGFHQGTGDFQARWEDRNPWNIPGPIYVGDDDSCGTGPMAAPNNVYMPETNDESRFLPARLHGYGGEFVFRQPSTLSSGDDRVRHLAQSKSIVPAYSCRPRAQERPRGSPK